MQLIGGTHKSLFGQDATDGTINLRSTSTHRPRDELGQIATDNLVNFGLTSPRMNLTTSRANSP